MSAAGAPPAPDQMISNRQQFLALLAQIPDERLPQATPLLFEALAAWGRERGPSIELLDAVCDKLGIDRAVGSLYLHCPDLIPAMERLRQGEKVHNVKVSLALSAEGRRWWHALLIVGVLWRRGGAVDHVRLVRWLAHRAVAEEIRSALAYLRDHALLETFHAPGRDPVRPVTWHKFTDHAATAMKLQSSPEFQALERAGPLVRAICHRQSV